MQPETIRANKKIRRSDTTAFYNISVSMAHELGPGERFWPGDEAFVLNGAGSTPAVPLNAFSSFG